jgi:hypothetical protein
MCLILPGCGSGRIWCVSATPGGGAALLAGESLQPYYSLGHRLLVLEAGQLRKQPLLEHRARPLATYLALV